MAQVMATRWQALRRGTKLEDTIGGETKLSGGVALGWKWVTSESAMGTAVVASEGTVAETSRRPEHGEPGNRRGNVCGRSFAAD